MLRLLVACFSFFILSPALASPPVFVEYFPARVCQQDYVFQERVQSLLKQYDNVFLVHCRTSYNVPNVLKELDRQQHDSKTYSEYSHTFCNERQKAYRQKFSASFYTSSAILVNGRWDANVDDVAPALKLGRLDGVKPIQIAYEDGAESVSLILPSLDVSKHSELLIYAYLPSIEEDREVLSEAKGDDAFERSVPFVQHQQPARASGTYLRPVVGYANVGKWDGSAQTLSFQISDLFNIIGYNRSDLSYVAVAHSGGIAGDVVAAGEFMSVAQQGKLLPYSKPSDPAAGFSGQDCNCDNSKATPHL